MVRCAISDSRNLSADPDEARELLLESVRRWAVDGVELIQMREKHLEAGALLALAEQMMQIVQIIRADRHAKTKLLINGRADVAIAARADGVHLTSRDGELTPAQVRTVFTHAGLPKPIVSVSCHGVEDVIRARDEDADYILIGPVFEKRSGGDLLVPGCGLERLHRACETAAPVPVLALGGVSEENTAACLGAGAAGIAAIRLFR
jgi:thiamine-phosphate pyrophosphorylase